MEGAPEPADAREAVEGYAFDHEAIPGLVDAFGADALLEAVGAAVASGDLDRWAWALGFLRDSINYGRDRRMLVAFYGSDLLEDVRAAVITGDFHLRHQAVYTLGKCGPRSNAATLRAALPWFVEHDPLQLDCVLSELLWLTGHRRLSPRPFLTTWTHSRDPLVRWAALGMIWGVLGRTKRLTGPGWAVQLVRLLAQDPHPQIRADAQQILELRRAGKGYVEPPFGLQFLNGFVGSHLIETGTTTYDLALIEMINARLRQRLRGSG